jgi:hypothetical protein
MSQFSNPEYEAMTPQEKVQWHCDEAVLARHWYRDSYRGWVVSQKSQAVANRHERCARILKQCYGLQA